jgi:hypothetical protein
VNRENNDKEKWNEKKWNHLTVIDKVGRAIKAQLAVDHSTIRKTDQGKAILRLFLSFSVVQSILERFSGITGMGRPAPNSSTPAAVRKRPTQKRNRKSTAKRVSSNFEGIDKALQILFGKSAPRYSVRQIVEERMSLKKLYERTFPCVTLHSCYRLRRFFGGSDLPAVAASRFSRSRNGSGQIP